MAFSHAFASEQLSPKLDLAIYHCSGMATFFFWAIVHSLQHIILHHLILCPLVSVDWVLDKSLHLSQTFHVSTSIISIHLIPLSLIFLTCSSHLYLGRPLGLFPLNLYSSACLGILPLLRTFVIINLYIYKRRYWLTIIAEPKLLELETWNLECRFLSWCR